VVLRGNWGEREVKELAGKLVSLSMQFDTGKPLVRAT